MGLIRRGGYIIIWWKGDHPPLHVHVRTQSGKKIGRLNLTTLRGIEGWKPEAKLVKIIQELQKEGRL